MFDFKVKKKVFIVGGTSGSRGVGRQLSKYISGNCNDFEVVGFLSRQDGEFDGIKKYEVSSGLPLALENADIIVDASASVVTYNNLSDIIFKHSDIIKKRVDNKPLLYFSITPDCVQEKSTKISNLENSNNFVLNELNRCGFSFIRTDKINTILGFFESHKNNIDDVLARGGKVFITDIHRTEKESFSQVLLNFLVDNEYVTEDERESLNLAEYSRRYKKSKWLQTNSTYSINVGSGTFEIFSYRETLNDDFKKTGMIGSTHILEFFDKDGNELYFDNNGNPSTREKADKWCFFCDEQLVKTMLNMISKKYKEISLGNSLVIQHD